MTLALSIVLSGLFANSASALPLQNVELGGDPDFDACGGAGVALVTTTLFRMDANGYLVFDRVEASQTIYFCDSYQDGDGEFVGVVVGEPGRDCGTGSAIPIRGPYTGLCKSGWIKREFTLLTAG